MSRKDRSKERLELRVSEEFVAMVDEWRRKQPGIPPRGTAVKMLCELAIRLEMAQAAEASSKKT
jgi:hypothetical protein